MTFQRELALAGLLLTAPLLSLPAEAEDKKTTSSAPARPAPAPVVRAAPAPAPVVRAPAPVVRAAPAPVVRAPATVTATRPASTVAVKPAATVATKPAVTTTAVKPATTATKPASTAAVKPATTTAAGTTSNIDRARNRIQSQLPADGAVRGDTQKKPSMVGVQASEFKPTVHVKPSAAPPSPGQPNFPKRAPNDPAPTNPLTTR